MATIPRYPAQGRVSPRPTGATFASADGASPAAFGVADGQALGGLAQAGKELSATLEKMADERAAADTKRLELDHAREIEALSYGEKGFFSLQGQAAVDALPKFRTDMAEVTAKYAGQLPGDRYREAFTTAAGSRELAMAGEASRFALREHRGYVDGASDARIGLNLNDGAASWANPQGTAQAFANIQSELASKASRNGWSAEVYNAQLAEYRTKMHLGVITNMVQADPFAAKSYLEQHKGEIQGLHLDAATKLVQTAYSQRTAQDYEARTRATGGTVGGAPGLERLTAAVERVESGGRETTASGAVLTSAAGAKGSMQVLDGTTRDPGFGVMPAKDDSPAERKRVGRDYLSAMMTRYDGNQTLALAAYNAGPGIVDDWISGTNKTGKNAAGLALGDPRGGAVTDAAWLAKVPYQETRDYVPRVLSVATGRPSLDDRLGQAARDFADDPKTLDEVNSRIIAEHGRRNAIEAEKQKAAAEEAFGVINKGGTLNDIPAATLAGLSTGQHNALLHKAENNGKAKTDLAVYTKFERQAGADPEGFAKIDLLMYSHKLSEADYKRLVELQREALQKGPAGENITQVRTVHQMVGDTLNKLGIKHGETASKDDAGKADAFTRRVQDEVLALEQREKRKAKPDEVQGIVDRWALQVVASSAVWPDRFGGGAVHAFSATAQDIPAANRDEIKALLLRHGVPVTDYNIVRMYAIRTQAEHAR